MSHPNPSSPWGAPGHGQQPGVPQPGGQPSGAQPGQSQSGAQPGGVQNPGSTPDASYPGGQYGQPGGQPGQHGGQPGGHGGQPGGQYPGGQPGQSAPGQESGYPGSQQGGYPGGQSAPGQQGGGSPWGASGSGPQHGAEHGGAWQAQGSAPQEAGYGSAPQQPGYGSAPQQAGYGSAPQHPGQPNPGQGGQPGYGSAPQQPGYGSAPQAGGFGGANPGVPMPETVGKKAKGPKKPKAPGAGLIGPLTLRDILLLVAGLFALVALATPGYAFRVQGISGNAEWFVQRWSASTIGYVVLGLLPILAAAVLTLVNKLTGSIRLIGSLSVDQLISVLASVAFAMNFVWLATMAVSFHVGSVFGFLAAIIAFVSGTLTVIPVFGKEFAYRAATDAHPKARPYSKSATAQGPVVGAQGGPNAQAAHMAQPGIPGQEHGVGQAHGADQAYGAGQAQAGSQPAGGFGSQPGSQFAPEQGSQAGSEFAPGQGSQPGSQSGAGADEPASQPASGPSQPWAQPSGQQMTAGGGAGYGAGHGAFAPQNDSQSVGAQPGQAQHNGQAGQGETPGQPWAQQSQPGEQASQPWAQNGGQPNQPGDHGQQDQGDKGQGGQSKKDEDTFHTSDDEQAYLGRHSAKEPRYAQNQPTQAFMTGGKENQTSDQPGGPWAQSAATSGSAVGESHKTDASQNIDASQKADEPQKADQFETAGKSKDASEADGAEGAGSRSAGAAAGVAGAGVAAGVAGVAGAAGAAGASDVSGSTGDAGVAGATGTTGATGATGATGDAQPQNPWAKPGAPTEAGREHEVANTSGAGANAQDDAPREPDARGDAASRVADDNEPTQYFRPYEYSDQGFEPVDGSGDQETQVAHAVQPQQGNEAQAPVSEPFWFAVPEPRPAVDETTGETVFMVTPGEWFLAQEDRGTSYVVHNSAQQEGILHNVSDVILP